MTSLEELQRVFARDLLQDSAQATTLITDAPPVPPATRLDVYRNAYSARLVEALETDYPALKHLTGEDVFVDICHAYIRSHPSTYRSLRWYGQRLAGFLEQDAVNAAAAEMARFEWGFVEAFDARDVDVLSEPDMAGIAPERWPGITVRFHPSTQRIPLSWNTVENWQAAKEGEPASTPARQTETQSCLIWREGLVTRYRTLEPDEARALESMAEGATFAALCEQLSENYEDEIEAALRAASLLKTWLAHGLVTEMSVVD
jgi:hypothetical protein